MAGPASGSHDFAERQEAASWLFATDHLAELANVRTGDEGPPGADHHDGGDPGSLAALAMDNRIPSGTPGVKAFTGGLEIVIHATSP
jgi:hypothetical protein